MGGAGGGYCASLSIVSDPVFQTTTQWQTTGSAVVDPNGPGASSLGRAELVSVALCNGDSVSQTLTVPDITTCGPARLVGWADTTGTGQTALSGTYLNGNWHTSLEIQAPGWTEFSHCLGEASYGGSADLGFAIAYMPFDCQMSPTSFNTLFFDDVQLQWDPSCPEVGKVINGDLETGNGLGWTASASAGATAAADVPGIGVGGSFGARLESNQVCALAELHVPMSVRLLSTMPHPALSLRANFTDNPTADYSATVKVEGAQEISFDPTGTFDEVRICLPHHLAGGVYNVNFKIDSWGTCSTALVPPLKLIVDDLAVLNDPSCLHAGEVLDPGIEMSITDSRRYGWALATDASSYGGNPVAEAINDPAAAHTGNGSLSLEVDQPCDSASASHWFEVPAPTLNAGPALAYWYKYPVQTNSSVQIYVRGVAPAMVEHITSPKVAAVSATYTREIVCLPPKMATRPASVLIELSAWGLCDQFLPTPEEFRIDDFELTTDASCPTN